MKFQQRGRFTTVLHDDGRPIELVFRGTLLKQTHDAYVHLSMPEDIESTVHNVDETIRRHTHLEYSPYLRGAHTLVTKKAPKCDPIPEDNAQVEVHIKLGNFGSFGYCWTLVRCVEIL